MCELCWVLLVCVVVAVVVVLRCGGSDWRCVVFSCVALRGVVLSCCVSCCVARCCTFVVVVFLVVFEWCIAVRVIGLCCVV